VTYETDTAQPVAPTPPPPPAPARRRWYTRKRWWIAAVVIVLFVAAGVAGATGSDEDGATLTDSERADAEPEPERSDPPATTGTTEAAEPEPEPQAPTTVPMGTKLTFDQTDSFSGDLTFEVTVANPVVTPQDESEYPMDATNGTFVAVEVVAAVPEGEGTYSAGTYNFRFVAADGTVFESTYATFDPQLPTTDLAAGQRAAGRVVFDIPANAVAGGKVQLDNVGAAYGEPLAFWAMP
jgi:cytoskeletal protein RodZ